MALRNQPHQQSTTVQDAWLWIPLLLVGALLTALSMARYAGYNAGMLDLGNMTQAITSVLRGEPLVYTSLRGTNLSRLSGHVELIYGFLSPLWLLWADPRALLIAQAALAVSGAIPVYRIALRRLESRVAARCAALIYLLYPVMQTAVLFDLHGDTLAMPLLLWAVDALDRRAHALSVVWVALALMAKVYVALPMAGIGFVFWRFAGRPKAGLAVMVASVLYGAVVFFGVREWFASDVLGGSALRSYTSHYFGDLAEIALTLPERALNAAILFLPAALLAWRGWRWLLPGLPVAAAVLISTGPGSGYDYRYHHYALVVPFIVLAVIDGAARLRAAQTEGKRGRNWRNDMVFTTLVVGLVGVVLVDTPLNPLYWMGLPGYGRDHAVYGRTERDALKDRWLAEQVPPDAPIAASMYLAPRLADRETLYVVRYPDDPGGERLPTLLPQVDYVVADGLFDWRLVAQGGVIAGAAYERAEIGVLLGDPHFGLVEARDGLLLFARDAGPAALEQTIAVVPQAELASQARSFGPIELLGAEITPLGERRYLAAFEWRRTSAALADALIAVSRLDGIADARILHLPSFALLPPEAWEPGAIIRERFVIELPPEATPGRYTWMLGWYRTNHPEGHATDARSLAPGSAEQPIITLEVTE